MNDGRLSRMSRASTRSGAGKKVTSWSVSFPDGSAEILVTLHSESGQSFFRATAAANPLLSGMSWEGTDIEDLAQVVERDIETCMREHYESRWEPAVKVETSVYKSRAHDSHKDMSGLQVRFELTPLHVDCTRPVGNRGETYTMEDGKKLVVIQREHDQVFETDGSLEPGNMRFSLENSNSPVARVVLPVSDRDAVEGVQSALEHFSTLLMRRMGPECISCFGPPRAGELTALMEQAEALVEAGPEAEGQPGPDP